MATPPLMGFEESKVSRSEYRVSGRRRPLMDDVPDEISMPSKVSEGTWARITRGRGDMYGETLRCYPSKVSGSVENLLSAFLRKIPFVVY
jgi:hypothetical protein